jgi:hypothetical protein
MIQVNSLPHSSHYEITSYISDLVKMMVVKRGCQYVERLTHTTTLPFEIFGYRERPLSTFVDFCSQTHQSVQCRTIDRSEIKRGNISRLRNLTLKCECPHI